ncbi:MAG: inositol monophosphatase [Planctomycetes bacterium]|nr:inositol monophosphatase [Planctomycetota bacterium]
MAEHAFTALELEGFRATAVTAAHAAGAILLEQFEHIERAAVRSKTAARDLVTAADVAAERVIVEHLRRACPTHAIEAEEEVRDALDRRPRWFVDPLDGTVNFVHGIPVFSVSIGLYDGETPLVGVVHAPRLGETFTARRGGGAFLGTKSIRVSDATQLSECVLATGFPYRRNELPNNNVANFDRLILEIRGIRRMGSAAIDLAYVAAGRLDGYWELHLSPHDVAAGALLVREAGGIVTDVDGGDTWLRAGHVVAGGARIVEALRPRLRA